MGKRNEQRFVPPPMQEFYPLSQLEMTEPQEDGTCVLVFRIPAPNKQVMFMMSGDVMEDLAKKITAPRVVVPTAAEAAQTMAAADEDAGGDEIGKVVLPGGIAR